MVDLNKILILTSGKALKLDTFDCPNKASFDDVWYDSLSGDLRIGERDLKEFDLIYFRMVGKSLEIATLVADYANKNCIKIVDGIYENSRLFPLSLGKSLELRELIAAGLPVPKTVFGRFDKLAFPFVVKSTSSSRGREVWLIRNQTEMEELRRKFAKNKFYFSQEFIPGAHRIRALVIGEKIIGAIERQTKWNKDEVKETLVPVPKEVERLALLATKAVGLDICGVDILTDEKGEKYVIEANAAPSWNLISRYCGVNVEDEILKYLRGKI